VPISVHEHSVIIFDRFAVGEFGQLGVIESGRLLRSGNFPAGTIATSGMWTGMNMVILPDGSLAPQPDPKAQATSLPALAGSVVDMGMGSNGTLPILWFKAGNKIYQSGPGPTFSFTAVGGTSANALSYVDRVAANSTFTFALTSGGVLEVIDHVGATVAAVAGTPPTAATLCQYNDRLMLGGDSTHSNRLYFSAAGNFASWPAANFIDVGDAAPIVAVTPLRSTLLIAKSGGTDETWWMLRGTPGVNAVLRRVSRFQGPGRANNLALLNDGRVGFAATTLANGVDGSTLTPATFDGANGRVERSQIGVLSDSLTAEAYRMVDSNDVLLKNNLFALIRRSGAWTRYSFPSGMDDDTSHFSAKSRTMAIDPAAGTFYLMNNAATAFSKWHPYATRPAFAADTDGAAPESARFTLPEWRALAGEEVCVASIVVAFKKWNTGSGVNNGFIVTATATGTYPTGVTSGSGTGTFSEDPAQSDVGGTLARATYTFAPHWGNGFVIDFNNVVGVAIRSVTVNVATRPIPGVS
jgi:hypothetical protein